MATREYMLLGTTHVDLAWKWGPAEMTEMLEAVVVRVLDALEFDPTFKYTLEQAAHYRVLARTRPDLVARLKPYLAQGRLELAGCMASTMETNLPSGESFVRNQLLGIRWARDAWDYAPRGGWLIDTFGINAQVPQILRQFGLRHLSANRFGGDKVHDAFTARGLDGSEVLVVGRDVYSPAVRARHVAEACYRDWDHLDRLFADADRLPGDGPVLLFANTENEMVVSLRPYREVRARAAARPGERWAAGTPHEFFAALDRTALDRTAGPFPVEHADLNPEFTGCFSLRPAIRLRNRAAETRLLEAEKWACLTGLTDWEQLIEDAWWDMAYCQFHDVFTGSHPTPVYTGVIETFDRIDGAATLVLDRAVDRLLSDAAPLAAGGRTLLALNGLPWPRRGVFEVAVPHGSADVARVALAGEPVPFEVRDGALRVLATLPPTGVAAFAVEDAPAGQAAPAPKPAAGPVPAAVIENEFVRLEFDADAGLRRMTWLPTGRVLVADAGGLLVAQQDDGNFQIESPNGAPVPAHAGGNLTLVQRATNLGEQIVVLAGQFPHLAWAGPDNRLAWEIEFSLAPGRPVVDVRLRLTWKGEATRVRLNLPTTIDAGAATYEVPFGTTVRRPYGTRGTARGEWPAQRFVAVEDATHGIAVVNTGAAGVELVGGALVTSLLRAPHAVYAGMKPDESSSQHGDHAFRFAIAPYAGTWADAGVARAAQEVNNPVLARLANGRRTGAATSSHLAIDGDHVVLSTVKRPEDGAADEFVLRAYETAGRAGEAVFTFPGVRAGWASDLPEARGEPIPVEGDTLRVRVRPYEIKTIRVARPPHRH